MNYLEDMNDTLVQLVLPCPLVFRPTMSQELSSSGSSYDDPPQPPPQKKQRTNGGFFRLTQSSTITFVKGNPKIAECPNMAVKKAYRQMKSELVCELLYYLWDKNPSEYTLRVYTEARWKAKIWPLVNFGLPQDLAVNDMTLFVYGIL